MIRLSREQEAAALFATHGLADAVTTVLAASMLGVGSEGNPVVAALLAESIPLAVTVMLGVVGTVSLAWPILADRFEFPGWFGPSLAVVGLLAAVGNVGVILA